MAESIEKRARFDFIRYANCWEDADILCSALQAGPKKRILSICSAGDNSFSILSTGAEVVAVDLNFSQIAIAKLKLAAIVHLEHEKCLAFLGILSQSDRVQTYQNILKPHLDSETSHYWNEHLKDIDEGVIHTGKFERYFQMFRTKILPLIHSKKEVDQLVKAKTIDEQEYFYANIWNNIRWQLIFRLFSSRLFMGWRGRDPEFFKYVKGSVSNSILERTKYALTKIFTHNNPYLLYIVKQDISKSLWPYLQPETYKLIRKYAHNIHFDQGTVQEIAEKYDGFDGYNLSDIFEYLAPDLCEDVYRRLLQKARPQARFVYWNMLVPRQVPTKFADQVTLLAEDSKLKHKHDRAWFYSRFIIEEKK